MKQEQVEFHNISAWAGLASIIEQYTSKGKKVYVEGRLQTRSWDDPSGQKRYKTEVVAENIILLSTSGSREDSYGDTPMSTGNEEMSSAPKTKKTPKIEEEIHIEDIPF